MLYFFSSNIFDFWYVFYTHSISEVGLTTFQGLNSHALPVTPGLNSAVLEAEAEKKSSGKKW